MRDTSGRRKGRGSGGGAGADGAERALADRLHSAAIHLLRRVRTADAASGMSAARLSVLSVLVFGEGARTVGELAALEQVTLPTMTRLLQGLEADGYVTRRRSRADARVVRVAATAAGRNVLHAARAARVALVDEILAALTPAESVALSRALGPLERALSDRASATRARP